MKYHVLDHGFVDYDEEKDIFGDELSIVNAARVSFGNRKEILDERDEKLIHYLLKHKHYSPFRHIFFRFHIKAPEFVMRQWYKHVVGCEWTSTHPTQLHGWNEISGRYIESFQFYSPHEWRQQSSNKKQGSDGLIPLQQEASQLFHDSMNLIFDNYHKLINLNVAKEQARIILPLNVYTEVIWTTSLQSLFHFVQLRQDTHSQLEIQYYANIFANILQQKFPIVWNAFVSNSNQF